MERKLILISVVHWLWKISKLKGKTRKKGFVMYIQDLSYFRALKLAIIIDHRSCQGWEMNLFQSLFLLVSSWGLLFGCQFSTLKPIKKRDELGNLAPYKTKYCWWLDWPIDNIKKITRVIILVVHHLKLICMMSSIFNDYKSGFWEQVEKHWNILIYIITVNFFHPVDHECLQETRKRFVARLYCYFHSAVYWKSFWGPF